MFMGTTGGGMKVPAAPEAPGALRPEVPASLIEGPEAKSEEQNEARKQMIVDLAQANRRLEEMMAENTGLHAQLLTQAREAGVLGERQRMAREIHDTLAQGLTGIITQLEAAQQARRRAARAAADGHPADWERRVGNATRLARDSLAEARRSVRALRPAALENNTKLPEALAEVTDRWSAVSGVPATVTTTGTPRGLQRQRPRGRRGGGVRAGPAAPGGQRDRPLIGPGAGQAGRPGWQR